MSSREAVPAFVCRRCGECCRGRGGIIVTAADVRQLRAHFGLSREAFARDYLEEAGGRLRVRTKEGWCVFFSEGCLAHSVKPSVCLAWPFFRGNMIDASSWKMAQKSCPGINPAAGHTAFVRQGLEYLRSLGLDAGEEGCPNALNLKRCRLTSTPDD